jgi:hypothetical protein
MATCVISKKRPLGTCSYVAVMYVHKRFVLHFAATSAIMCVATVNDCQGPYEYSYSATVYFVVTSTDRKT